MRTRGTVDDWYRDCATWRDEVAGLRAIVLDAGLEETLKWGQPTYTDQGRNILMISVRKAGALVSFLRGALLDDPEGRLEAPGENSRHTRYLRVTGVEQIAARDPYLRALVAQAVALERAGARIEPPPDLPAYGVELRRRLTSDEPFRRAFEALTPGRRRAYDMHFSQPKGAAARLARIERCTERILQGKGLNDCICGRTRRPPRCDGSHRGTCA